MRGVALVSVVVAALALPPEARADSAAETQFKQAIKFYEAGDYIHAARAFAKAYRLERQSKYLFGWAQSERMRGRCKTAIALFDEFLTLAPSPQDVVAARSAMKRCGAEDGPPESSDSPSSADERAEAGDQAQTSAPAEPLRVSSRQPESGGADVQVGGRGRPRREPPDPFRWGFGGRVDLDPLHRGAVLAPCVAIAKGSFEAFGNALLGGNQGLEVGARLASRAKTYAPYLSLSAPLFFIDGARVGVRGAVGLRFWLSRGWAVTGEVGGAALATPPPGLDRTSGLVSLAMEVWD